MSASAPQTVDAYIAAAVEENRRVLQKLRAVIKAAAPQAEEKISYGIPLYYYHGHLVGFGSFKNHCSLFVTGSKVREALAKELAPFEIHHTTIHFTPENPLPDELVTKIVQFRVSENEDRQ